MKNNKKIIKKIRNPLFLQINHQIKKNQINNKIPKININNKINNNYISNKNNNHQLLIL